MYNTPFSNDDRNMGMLCHLLALSGFIFPFGHIVGPLIFWLIKKDTSRFVDDQGKQVLNFQISMTLYAIVIAGAGFIIGIITCGVGWILALVLIGIEGLINLILTILGAAQASNGVYYRYPFAITLLI